MLALRKTRAGRGVDLVRTGFDGPEPGPGEVEVAIRAAGICGSDLHAAAWDPSYGFMEPFLPLTIGHEFAGAVTATGSGVAGLEVGDRVVCWPTVPCGDCDGCRAGRPSACEARRIAPSVGPGVDATTTGPRSDAGPSGGPLQTVNEHDNERTESESIRAAPIVLRI